jgi:hypothetical protein
MPNINFPTSPALNDQYSFEGKTWTWNGVAWIILSSPTSLRINSAYGHANSAFSKANNALANTSGTTFGGELNIAGKLNVLTVGGDEGGEIRLGKALTNTSLVGQGINIDVYQNKLRIWEDGGTNRGVYIDMANSASAGVGTNLLAPNSSTDGWSRDQANASFAKANTADQRAVTSGAYANSSYTHANAAFAYANTISSGSVDTFARTQANAAFSAANSAQSTASSASSEASSAQGAASAALGTAAAAQETATSAYIQANAAFSAANNAFNASQPLSGEFDYGLITDINNTIQDYGTI